MNLKWQCKIKKFNVKTVVQNSSGPKKNKNSTRKKALTPHYVVKIAVQKHVQTSITEEAEVETEVQDNLSQ